MELKGKKVLVVGLGKSGLAAALFLRRRGAQVTVSDIRSAEALSKDIPALIEQGIAVEAGGHGLLTFRRQDLIVVSPGVPLDTPELVQVRKFGLPIIGEVELAARFLKGKTLAITGSNGKTTTTSLCGAILERAHQHVQVGGNIGLPVIALVDDSRDDGWSVLEISSFQLETTERFRPGIAVILNITPDHLDRHGSFENYVAAKERIFAAQTHDDALILNADDDAASRAAARASSRIFWFSRNRVIRQGAFVHEGNILFRAAEDAATEPILPLSEIPLKGAHNVENVLAAVCAARLAGVSAEAIRDAVRDFRAVEHRLEFVAEIGGVSFYNDSKATNVDAARKAIEAFPGGIHLILGGKDKNSDYRTLRPLMAGRVKAVYTIGSAAEKIMTHLDGAVPLIAAGTLDLAVNLAGGAASPGDVVLLAPACSSFDQFENYEQRGQVFKDLVLAHRGAAAWQNASA
ncbi:MULTISPECIES: UDP-N-acetylmuramoyl-L-alanine--D-glutamate ligase [Acidobacterium]|uniref:UDP-N-acetylmuramoylalanine--D-glutamate ligase n=1 Tax=Acidobacterium capsulatum (strain ATCC 51196 / DSM 11244 / BCRC 80197 / JCM 7670 / NBRC 15755 / NCIMB 13165 / 161) TaxID=240015 RepID=MURD_ACIC5|nr:MULTISPECIES: UDP-N-acetylmuramoyl-L-alanine--D-glutamate ligase [Acidobacterium]C1F460.1 RecName: Full=UDP-N-acetylmuramoylalanine--D-glutamate ligase; AltName: Full=D-glutamic acid-adding enzyme; AltName: Full=UDP-N-acetylmuramoyl-L-alanyl-D-glutamate synthetase [Acidobacterium capsulatum ATCC 51196]ACO34542.1 UDP-N-acetylmuramoyl-L-alanine--D-glutamate ligase [Acidobacterium capsulatum ATCC 51196]HCT60316.1 UDP-N-acetylmuramoyl-L-alanine--D-glutamate ligase [Acidobacterium sp.]